LREKYARQAKGRVWLVRFFDETSSYVWVGKNKLDFFGDDGKSSFEGGTHFRS